MMRRLVCSVPNLFVLMLYIQLVSSRLPPDQVRVMTRVYDIFQNDTGASSVWQNVSKNSNPCSWRGVNCSSDNSSIKKLSFHQFSISTSEFLPLLCTVDTLQSLDVSNNLLTSIPAQFYTDCGRISGLKFLNFSMNRLSGPLPTFNGFRVLEILDFSRNLLAEEINLQLDGLGSLKSLNLSWNKFIGTIPTNLGKMNLLEDLRLSRNNFTGEIPVEITKYRNLSVIDLRVNGLSGSIPAELGELTRLETLELSLNNLSGRIPSSFSKITTLKRFAAYLNQLNGTIPSGITSYVGVLDLSDNKLTGTISVDLLSGPNLQSLDLSYNGLEGPIPAINSTILFSLILGSNSLDGAIPSGITSNLGVLDLSYNKLTGTIPADLLSGPNLQSLYLTSSGLEGPIPAINSTRLMSLRLGSNSLNGTIPSESLESLRELMYLELDNNRLSGELPLGLGSCRELVFLNLAHNRLTGWLPSVLGSLTYLQELSLESNHFVGEIPSEISRLSNLTTLNLQGNNLSGGIPVSIGSLSSLIELQLGKNQLSGRIPSMPPKLQIALNLSYNLFDGPIPASLSKLLSLEVLDLSNNRLSGQIPDSIGSLPSLIELQLGKNQLRGRIPYMPPNLKISLNLSYNLFDGPIPVALSELSTLKVLDLSNNRFAGEIPGFLNQLGSLTHLLLSNNQLTGVVPKFANEVEIETRGNNNLIYPKENPSPPPQRKKKSKSISSNFVIAFSSGIPVGLLMVLVVSILRRYNRIRCNLLTTSSIYRSNIDFKKAMEAVANPSNITLKTRFSTYYKAVMPSGTSYLIKKVSQTSNKIFQLHNRAKIEEELEDIGKLCNSNVMIPLAYVLTGHVAYLFYDFAPKCTLFYLLHRTSDPLDWASRFSIAIGVSQGLAFLHECESGPFLLLDLSSESILMKSLNEPQIGDIELCKIIRLSKSSGSIPTVAGSFGYIPAEYAYTMGVTATGNVYSFGVVLLELLTGKPAVNGGTELAKWALSNTDHRNRWEEILGVSVSKTSLAVRSQMLAVLEVALACISTEPETRPNMVSVLQMLLNTRS